MRMRILFLTLFLGSGLLADVAYNPSATAVSLANTTAALSGTPDYFGNPASIGSANRLTFVSGWNILFPGLLPAGQEIMSYHVSVVTPLVVSKKAVLLTGGLSIYNRPVQNLYELLTISAGAGFNFAKFSAVRSIGFQNLTLGVRVKAFEAKYIYNGELGLPTSDLKTSRNVFNSDVGLQAGLANGLSFGFVAYNMFPFGYGSNIGTLATTPAQVEGNEFQMALGARWPLEIGRFVVLTPALEGTYFGSPLASGSTNNNPSMGGRVAVEANFFDLIYLRLGGSLGLYETFNMGVGMGLQMAFDKFIANLDLAFKWLPLNTELGTSIQALAINLNVKI